MDYTLEKLVQHGIDTIRARERDLSDADLSRRILTAVDLKGYTITGANFEGSDFSGADLRALSFSRSNCVTAIFIGADLRSADLAFGFFHNADFRGADLRGARLADAVANECNFSGADLRGAIFGREHYDSDFRGADLRGATVPPDGSFEALNCDTRGSLVTPAGAMVRSANKRATQRALLLRPLTVVDRRTTRPAGTLLDISATGMRMTGLSPIPIDALFPFQVLLPDQNPFGGTIEIDARSVWCRKLAGSDSFNTGFQFVRMSPNGLEAIRMIIEGEKAGKMEITDQIA
jgi:uncharacterized protein YjbI with pentapeptide repeats